MLLPAQQSQRGDYQQCTEEVLNPCKALQQCDPGKDENAAHDDGAQDAKQERFPLQLVLRPKERNISRKTKRLSMLMESSIR